MAVRACVAYFFCANGKHQKLTAFFSLGNFQWCICKYEDGPCLDFSGGMFTVCCVFDMMSSMSLNFVLCVITTMNAEISAVTKTKLDYKQSCESRLL